MSQYWSRVSDQRRKLKRLRIYEMWVRWGNGPKDQDMFESHDKMKPRWGNSLIVSQRVARQVVWRETWRKRTTCREEGRLWESLMRSKRGNRLNWRLIAENSENKQWAKSRRMIATVDREGWEDPEGCSVASRMGNSLYEERLTVRCRGRPSLGLAP